MRTNKTPDPVKPVPVSPTADPARARCSVNGSPVSSFHAMFDRPGHLIMEDGGTHEFTRVFFHDGKFNVGGGYNDRLGPMTVKHVNYDFVLGLTVELVAEAFGTYVLHVPPGAGKACWKA